MKATARAAAGKCQRTVLGRESIVACMRRLCPGAAELQLPKRAVVFLHVLPTLRHLTDGARGAHEGKS